MNGPQRPPCTVYIHLTCYTSQPPLLCSHTRKSYADLPYSCAVCRKELQPTPPLHPHTQHTHPHTHPQQTHPHTHTQDYVSNHLGQRFIEPQTAELSLVFKDSSSTTPLIFVLSQVNKLLLTCCMYVVNIYVYGKRAHNCKLHSLM